MRLVENSKIAVRDAIGATGGLTTVGNGVSMAKYNRCRITLLIACNDAAVGGGAVTLKQGTSLASVNTELSFAEYWKNEDVLGSTGDALTRVEATSCSAGVRNKTAMYVFEVKSDMLSTDTDGSENTCIRLNLADITTATESCVLIYELYEPRYAMGAEGLPTVVA